MTKQQRYRQKCLSEGRCPHCGKPCAPYYVCDERSSYKRVARALKRGVEAGIFGKIKDGGFWLLNENIKIRSNESGRKGDKRFWPRIAARPIDPMRLLELAFINEDRAMTEPEINKAIAKIRVGLSRRVRKNMERSA